MEIKENPVAIKTKMSKKKKIILIDTFSKGRLHLNKRYKGYIDIPHYTVYKNGTIERHLVHGETPFKWNTGEYLVVALECLAELYYIHQTNCYHNLFGHIYEGKPFESVGKNIKYFDAYTGPQLDSLFWLLGALVKELDIEPVICRETKKQAKLDGISVLSKSNIIEGSSDINISFYEKKLETFRWHNKRQEHYSIFE